MNKRGLTPKRTAAKQSGRYPESLETLAAEGYVRYVPVDPFTGSSSTWRLVYSDRGGQGPDLPMPQDAQVAGLFDIKSGSSHQALDGSNVGDW